MRKPKLNEILDHDNGKVKLQYDKKTKELYVNGEKIVTKFNLDMQESWIAWIIASATVVQAIFAVLTYLRC